MERMNADGDLMLWNDSFMSDKSVSLVIDSYLCEESAVEMRVPQGLVVSPILFAIYMNEEFNEVEQEVEECMTTSFSDDCG